MIQYGEQIHILLPGLNVDLNTIDGEVLADPSVDRPSLVLIATGS
jgi:hypothetical protein